MNGVRLAVQAAAAYRLTRLVQVDDLPGLGYLRLLMSTKQAELARKQEKSAADHLADELIYMVNCPWCLGFWVSVLVIAADAIAPRAWRPLAAALALSAAVGHARARLD